MDIKIKDEKCNYTIRPEIEGINIMCDFISSSHGNNARIYFSENAFKELVKKLVLIARIKDIDINE